MMDRMVCIVAECRSCIRVRGGGVVGRLIEWEGGALVVVSSFGPAHRKHFELECLGVGLEMLKPEWMFSRTCLKRAFRLDVQGS